MKGAKTDGTGWDGMGWSGAFFNDFDDDDVLVYWYNPVYFLLSFLLVYFSFDSCGSAARMA